MVVLATKAYMTLMNVTLYRMDDRTDGRTDGRWERKRLTWRFGYHCVDLYSCMKNRGSEVGSSNMLGGGGCTEPYIF